jgi:hypothetical protein
MLPSEWSWFAFLGQGRAPGTNEEIYNRVSEYNLSSEGQKRSRSMNTKETGSVLLYECSQWTDGRINDLINVW